VSSSWYAHYKRGQRIGYEQTTIGKFTEGGRELLEIKQETKDTVSRGGDTAEARITAVSIETPTGQLVRCSSEQHLGGQTAVKASGLVQGTSFVLTVESGARKYETKRPWGSDVKGYFGVERSLQTQPLNIGEKRTLQVLDPTLHQIANVVLVAEKEESTQLLTGEAKLVKVVATLKFSGPAPAGASDLKMIYWVNATGQIQKTSFPQFEMLAYRVSREEALAPLPAVPLEIMTQTMVTLNRPLDRPHTAQQIKYRVRWADGDPSKVFLNSGGQSVQAIDPHTAEVTVRQLRPNSPVTADPGPTDADRQPNPWIQSDDPEIQRLAALSQTESGSGGDAWAQALGLESFVHRHLQQATYSAVMATAADVARSRKGDCTEYAMLLAALARARGIPARVAVGLVYIQGRPVPTMAFHMWTEVYVGQRWVPLDATLGQGGIGAGHLKVGQTNFSESTALAALLPISQIAGRLQIEVVDAGTE